MKGHIRQSNLIEGIDDQKEDKQSMVAWDYLKNLKQISHKDIKKVQKIITLHQPLRPDHRGYYRNVNVRVGNRLCPEWNMIPHLMANFIIDWRKNNPLENHITFEKIHPFVDGNGRTGRMLMWWQQIKNGEEPTLFKADERQEYYKLFKEE